jgi:transposase
MRRHTSAEFVAFLTDIVIDQPPGKEIHVIADNQSAHKSRPVTDFLAVHPKVHLHFTPTYSSWLNQVELWFSKIDRDVIARGVFTSVSDLKRKLLRYIRQYNKSPRTIAPSQYTTSRYRPLVAVFPVIRVAVDAGPTQILIRSYDEHRRAHPARAIRDDPDTSLATSSPEPQRPEARVDS